MKHVTADLADSIFSDSLLPYMVEAFAHIHRFNFTFNVITIWRVTLEIIKFGKVALSHGIGEI